MQNGRPLAYESRRLIPAEVNYTTGEQKLLAVVHACKSWRCYLEEPIFTIVTDHNPLVHLPTQPNLSRRQVRWVQYLSRFTFNWVYKPGATNKVADAQAVIHPKSAQLLSCSLLWGQGVRVNLKHIQMQLHHPNYKRKTKFYLRAQVLKRGGRDQVILLHKHLCKAQPILGNLTGPWTYMKLWLKHMITTLGFYPKSTPQTIPLKDGAWFTQRNQLIVPDMPSIRTSIIHELHSTPIYGHGGLTKTKKQVEKLFWWPSLLKDVTQFVKECPSCQINKS